MDYESGFFAQLYGLSIRFGRIALGNVRTHVLSSEEKLTHPQFLKDIKMIYV